MNKRKGRLAGRPFKTRLRRSTARHNYSTTGTRQQDCSTLALEQWHTVLTVGDLAAVLRVSENSVYELLKRGELLSLAVRVGNQWRFPRDRVRAFLEGQR